MSYEHVALTFDSQIILNSFCLHIAQYVFSFILNLQKVKYLI